MKIRTLTAAILAAGLALTASGCEELKVDQVMSDLMVENPGGQTTADAIDPETAVAYVEDAANIYRTLNYKAEMLRGKYAAEGVSGTEFSAEEASAAFRGAQSFTDCPGQTEKVTALPYRIDAGEHSNITPLN